jgi:Lipocalin-like domain
LFAINRGEVVVRTALIAAVLVITSASLLPAQQPSGATAGRSADSPPPVVGTWKVTIFSNVAVDTNESFRPFGDQKLAGYIQYSSDGYMVVFLQAGNQIKIQGQSFTDAERIEIHKSIFGAYAGTYSVEGNKVVHHVVAAWRPDWIGTDQVRFFEVKGKTLTIKTAPLTSNATGKKVVSTLTFEKME